LIQGAIDKEEDLSQMKKTFLFHRSMEDMGEPHPGGSVAQPNHLSMHEERVNTLGLFTVAIFRPFLAHF